MSGSFRLGLIQLSVCKDKCKNLIHAATKVKEAAQKGAKIVSLPECFNSPYGTGFFPEYAEEIPNGETSKALSDMAKENNIYLVGGSIPEKQNGQLYNTSTVWNPDGKLLGTYRKCHLFDIDIPGKITFKESDALKAGDRLFTFQTPFAKVGLGICYDIRFGELANIYSMEKQCNLILYPGAFNMTTGPAHWELLTRARALDNQVYVATVSPARDEKSNYVAWGCSTVSDPWGKVISKADEKETILIADIDLDYMNQVRSQIPIRNQRRNDLYTLKNNSSD